MTDDRQRRVAAFLDAHELHAPPASSTSRPKSAKSSGYGARPDELDVKRGELGDALFCICSSVCN